MYAYPRFANKQTSVQALGLALLTLPEQHPTAVYLSAAGAGVALKSLWASAVGNNSTGFYTTPWHPTYVHGAASIKSFYASLPNCTVQHLVAVRHHPHFFLATDPQALTATEPERQQLREQQITTQILPGFGLWLNDHSTVPVLDTWLPVIWSAALDPNHPAHDDEQVAITAAICHGDCLGAWELNPAYNWLRLVQWLLREGELSF